MASLQVKENPSDVVLSTISKGSSPESKCPICLDQFKNISYLDVCLHKFCFCCIHEWAKNKAQCPLCKQPFNSIYHTIKSEDNYQKFDLQPTENGSFGNVAGQRFRYRTTLTGERRPAVRRTSPPPDHGVLFEGFREVIPQRHNLDFHSMIRRMRARQRREMEGRTVPSLFHQEVVKFRRDLYRRGIRVQNVQDGGRKRETSAEFFKRNPACLHRLVPWLRRELTILYGSHGSLVNIVQHIIMSLVTRCNLDNRAVEHELRPFLLSHTEHFLHEFLSFAQSPFNMEAYDQHAVYDLPQPTIENSSSDNSVIAISEDEIDSLVTGAQDSATPMVTLSQTPWDDETPGPSYSSEPSWICPVNLRESDSDSSEMEVLESVSSLPSQNCEGNPSITAQEERSCDSDDCVIIGFVKPVTERTPELVQLSSDSDHSEHVEGTWTSQAPQHIRFNSDTDISPSVSPRLSGRPSLLSKAPEGTPSQRRKKNVSDKCISGSRIGSLHRERKKTSSHGSKPPLSDESRQKQRTEKEKCHNSYGFSYSHYTHGRSRKSYTETCSSLTNYCRRVYDHSWSHIGRRSEESHMGSNSRSISSSCRNRSHSRSNSKIISSRRRNRDHSRSNSKIISSRRRNRDHSRSNSCTNPSRWRNRSHSRSKSRTNSSRWQDRCHSRSKSRTISSSRRNRSNSRSKSRTNSSRRRDRSHSRSKSRTISSNRRNRSHSRSNSRTISSRRRDRSHSRSNSRTISSSHRNRSHSRSNSRTISSSHWNRGHSRSNSRTNSSRRRDRSHSRKKTSTNQNRQRKSKTKSNSSRWDKNTSSEYYYNNTTHQCQRTSRSSSSHQDGQHSRNSSISNASSSCQTDYGKKRRFKTKHNDDSSKKSSSTNLSIPGEDSVKKNHKKHKTFKKTKSPCVDDKSESHCRKHHKKKKHKKKSKSHKTEKKVPSQSPVLITITSDSDSAYPEEPSTSLTSNTGLTVMQANSAIEAFPPQGSFPENEQCSAVELQNLIGDEENNLQKAKL